MLRASHIVGGDIRFQCLGNDQYLLTVKVFRDCQHGKIPLDSTIRINMYENGSGFHRLVKRFMLPLVGNDTLVFVEKNCINIPDGCTHIGFYKLAFELNPEQYTNKGGYYFTWNRCCRNTVIRNINVGERPEGNTGITLYAAIPPLTTFNSTPWFKRDPLTLLCVDNPFSFNYEAQDPDGDSLVFSLVAPLEAVNDQGSDPFVPIHWVSTYNLNHLMDGNPSLRIDPHTGQLSVTPRQQGVYAIALRCEEFRHGVKIGEVRRELQLTISTCTANAYAQFVPDPQKDTFEVYPGQELKVDVHAYDPDAQDSLFFSARGELLDTSVVGHDVITWQHPAQGLAAVTAHLRWTPTCTLVRKRPYSLQLLVKDNGCPIAKTRVSVLHVKVEDPATGDTPELACLQIADSNTLIIPWKAMNASLFRYALLYRQQAYGQARVVDSITSPAAGKYVDDSAFDHDDRNYCYLLRMANVCGKQGSASNLACSSDAHHVPDPVYLVSASVEDNAEVELKWMPADAADFAGYQLYRKPNAKNARFYLYRSIASLGQQTFEDNQVHVNDTSYCYRIFSTNRCGHQSPVGNTACTILLTGQSQTFEHALFWNDYSGWKGNVDHYEIWRQDGDTAFLEINSSKDSCYLDDQLDPGAGAYHYKIIAREGPGGGNASSTSNGIFLYQSPGLYVPNSFTPNHDGHNDTWRLVPVFVKTWHVEVYNRWGERVFETENPKTQWDGTYKGSLVSEQVFLYRIRYTGWDHTVHYREGTVNVLR